MKKFISLLLAFALTLSCAAALAEESAALNVVETDVDPATGFYFEISENEWSDVERERMEEEEEPEVYFDQKEEIAEAAGDPSYDVNEFWYITAANYDASIGDVTATISFHTPYTKDTKVAVMIGFGHVLEDGSKVMEWHTFEGNIVENCRVVATFDGETVARIAQETALIAVVSRAQAPGGLDISTIISSFTVVAPSKRGEDLNKVETNISPITGFYILISEDKELIAWANEELERLIASENPQTYFDQAREIKALIEDPPYEVNEFWPVIAANYESSLGNVLAKFMFATPYEPDTKVAVLVGFKIGVDEEGKTIMEWHTFEGYVMQDSGVVTELDPETVERIETATALIAIVSK